MFLYMLFRKQSLMLFPPAIHIKRCPSATLFLVSLALAHVSG